MTVLGADVSGLERAANKCNQAAETADQIRTVMQALVIALTAAAWFTGGWSVKLAHVLQNVVIPWLNRIAAALRLFATVLGGNAQAQRRVSEGYPVDFGQLPTYPAPALPPGTATPPPATTPGSSTPPPAATPGTGTTPGGTTPGGTNPGGTTPGTTPGGTTPGGTTPGGTTPGVTTPGGGNGGTFTGTITGTINGTITVTGSLDANGANGSGSGAAGGTGGEAPPRTFDTAPVSGSTATPGSLDRMTAHSGPSGYSGGGGSSGGGGFSGGGGGPDLGQLGTSSDPSSTGSLDGAAASANADKPAEEFTAKPVAATVASGGVSGGQVAALGATALGAGLLGGSGAYAAASRRARNNTDGSEALDSTVPQRTTT